MSIYNEITLAKELIRFPSITPVDAGVMKFLAKKLTAIGFKCKILEFKDKDSKPVKNLYARLGNSQPNFMFAGHLDVVPPGNIKDWTIKPFSPAIKKNHLIGRGANDMKSAIAKNSLRSNGILIHMQSDQKIINTVNKIAPEHLELNTKNYKKVVGKIKNAGSICLGKYAVMAMTDYNVGSNHVLPTNSSARYSSGVSVNEFYKRISYINLSKKGIETLGPSVITLANYEGLVGHAKSVEKRIRRK